MEDLLSRIAQLKSQAAALCEPLGPDGRAGLLAAIEALPDARFEAAVALVLDHSRHDEALLEAAKSVRGPPRPLRPPLRA